MHRASIVVADRDPESRNRLKKMLADTGYLVVGEAVSGSSALRVIRNVSPDVSILSTNLLMPSGLEVARICAEDHLGPTVLLLPKFDWTTIEKANENLATSYVVEPITQTSLASAIELAVATYHRTAELETRLENLRERLETRRAVERAKGVLMRRFKISEDEAYRVIQKKSMDSSKSMRQVAEALLLAYDIESKAGGKPRPDSS